MSEASLYRTQGFLPQSFPLSDPSILPALLTDEARFTEALAQSAASGTQSVPYLLTDAICRVAQDPALIHQVESLLGTPHWVMWGPNIRRATPNQAHNWHVDLESLLWPTLTVAIGLSGCTPESATWVIPGTHHLQQPPPPNPENAQQITGFGDARFYLFNARLWHKGDPNFSHNRVVLFLHYQHASAPRIPLMLDYHLQHFSTEATCYFTTAPANTVSTQVASLPLWYRLSRWKSNLRYRLQSKVRELN